MENIAKLIERLRARKGNVRFRELERIVLRLGFLERRSKKGTSDFVFSHSQLMQHVTLVSHGKNDAVPTYQVNDVIKALEELRES